MAYALRVAPWATLTFLPAIHAYNNWTGGYGFWSILGPVIEHVMNVTL